MENFEKNEKTFIVKVLEYYLFFYAFISLSVFVIPHDILDKSQICSNFVNFMKQFFPNIEVFQSISPLPQLTAFYTSFMWVWGIILLIICFIVFFVGTKKIKDTINNYSVWFGLCGFLGFIGLYQYFTGEMAINGVSFGAKKIHLTFDTELEIFVPITFFQFGFSFMFLIMPLTFYILFLKIKNYFKEINK